MPQAIRNSRKKWQKFELLYYLIYTVYQPHTLDDNEREGSDEENSDSSTDRDHKSDGDESAASTSSIDSSMTLTPLSERAGRMLCRTP